MSYPTKNQSPLSKPQTVNLTAAATIEFEAAADGGGARKPPAPLQDGRVHRRRDARRGLAAPGSDRSRGPGGALAGTPDPLRARPALGRRPHRCDPRRGRAAHGDRRDLARHAAPRRSRGLQRGTDSPGRPPSARASRSSSSSRTTRRRRSTARNSPARSTSSARPRSARSVSWISAQTAAPARASPRVRTRSPASWPTIPTTSNPTPSPITATEQTPEQVRAAGAAETARIAPSARSAVASTASIEAQAIRDNWDATRTELEVLRASRPKAPAIHAPDTSVTSEVLEAACFQSAKLEGIEKVCSTQAMDRRGQAVPGRAGPAGTAVRSRDRQRLHGPHVPRQPPRARGRLRSRHRGGHDHHRRRGHPGQRRQQVSAGGLLQRRACVAEHLRRPQRVGLQDGHQLPPDRQGPVRAGRPGRRAQARARSANESYTNKADTYGLMLSIDRRDIINDDLGAITTVPRKLGRGSGLKINDVFWTAFMNNAAFFSAGNKNFSRRDTRSASMA
jgi:hypothetical protein